MIPIQFIPTGKYITNDATIVKLNIADESMNTLKLQVISYANETIFIDWGDNIVEQYNGSTAGAEYTHTYQQLGEYIVQIVGGLRHWFHGVNTLDENYSIVQAIKLYSKLTSLNGLFYNCRNLNSFGLDFKVHDGVDDVQMMFYGCSRFNTYS